MIICDYCSVAHRKTHAGSGGKPTEQSGVCGKDDETDNVTLWDQNVEHEVWGSHQVELTLGSRMREPTENYTGIKQGLYV